MGRRAHRDLAGGERPPLRRADPLRAVVHPPRRRIAKLSPQRYTYTAPSAVCIAQIASPASGTTLSATSVTFTWSATSGADQYWLDVGNSVGQGDLWAGALTTPSKVVSGLPLRRADSLRAVVHPRQCGVANSLALHLHRQDNLRTVDW